MTPYKKLRYSLEEFDFVSPVCAALCEPHLDLIQSRGLAIRRVENDQDTIWHKRFYMSFPAWRELYERFVRDFVAPLVGEPFYWQRGPSFRLHLPGNLAVGEFHRDSDYGHPQGEQNFWVPLTMARDSAAPIIEGQGVYAKVGEVVLFDAVNQLHGNEINRTGRSRASFDFRILPVRLYEPSESVTRNTKLAFKPGSYYAAEAMT